MRTRAEAFPLLTRELAGHLSREEDPELRRVLNDWWISLVHRIFPGVMISETLDLLEAPMLEETAHVRLKIQEITSKQELRRLGRKLAVAKSLRELGL